MIFLLFTLAVTQQPPCTEITFNDGMKWSVMKFASSLTASAFPVPDSYLSNDTKCSKLYSWLENLKKSRQKNSQNQINKYFFSWNCIFGSFKLFSSSKIDFWPFLKLQKMEFGQKNFREIDLFDFTSFFLAWTYCKNYFTIE